ASMGPRFGKRGRTTDRRQPSSRPPCFNGAALWEARKEFFVGDLRVNQHASMGPRFGKRGRGTLVNVAAGSGLLQWGRALGSAEGERLGFLTLTFRELQWGRALGSAEGGDGFDPRDRRIELQWGRALGSAEGPTT